MKILLLTTLLSVFCLVTIGQSKIILHKGAEREVIKEGKLLGVTLIGEENKYQNWKRLNKCNNSIRENLWTIDHIGLDSMYLTGYNYSVSFHNDTILRHNINSLKNNDYIIDTVIPSETGKQKFDKLVCRIATLKLLGEKHKTVKYDNIETLTFAHLDLNKETTGYNTVYLSNSHGLRLGNHPCHLGIHPSGKRAAIALLVILSIEATVVITACIVDDIETEVHTYDMKDWKIKIK